MSRNPYIERINRVIDHVNAHLDEALPLERLAQVAHLSAHHFHRIFKAVMEETVHGFVKRSRLERAAFLLKSAPHRTLTDIAFECGFRSSSDFSRSFKKHFGFPPRDSSRERLVERLEKDSKICQALLSDTPQHRSRLNTEFEGEEFTVQRVEMNPGPVAYVRVIAPLGENRLDEGLATLRAWAEGEGLWDPRSLRGLSLDDPEITPPEKYRYELALPVPEGTRGAGEVGVQAFAGGGYASVTCRGGILEVDRAWRYLYHHWLLHSRWQPADGPALELYHEDPSSSNWTHYHLDARIPVRPL